MPTQLDTKDWITHTHTLTLTTSYPHWEIQHSENAGNPQRSRIYWMILMRITTSEKKKRCWPQLDRWVPVSGLQTKRHLSSGRFYSLLLNYWMDRGEETADTHQLTKPHVCMQGCGMPVCSFHYVRAHHLSVQVRDAAWQMELYDLYSTQDFHPSRV